LPSKLPGKPGEFFYAIPIWGVHNKNRRPGNFFFSSSQRSGILRVPNLTNLNQPSQRKSPGREVGAFLMGSCRVILYLFPEGAGEFPLNFNKVPGLRDK
jgi:hypothetical protein